MVKELALRREQLDNLQKRQEEMDAKSKSDIKVLVKEVKSLRTTQNELKDELNRVVKEKSELEVLDFSFLIFPAFHVSSLCL